MGSDAILRSEYVWRGIARHDGWVLQADAYLALAAPTVTWTAGWWSLIALTGAPAAVGEAAALEPRWFGENDVWAEASAAFGRAQLSAGVTRYLFAREREFTGRADRVSTTELYLRSQLDLDAVRATVTLYEDVDRVRGGFAETELGLRIPTLPSYSTVLSLQLIALAGWNMGQGVSRKRDGEAATYAETGLTHVDLGLRFAAGGPRLYLTLEGGVQFSSDPFVSGPGRDGTDDARWWIALGVSPSLVAAVL